MKTPIVTEVDLVTGHVVPAVRERGTPAPPLFAHVYCAKNKSKGIALVSYYIQYMATDINN